MYKIYVIYGKIALVNNVNDHINYIECPSLLSHDAILYRLRSTLKHNKIYSDRTSAWSLRLLQRVSTYFFHNSWVAGQVSGLVASSKGAEHTSIT